MFRYLRVILSVLSLIASPPFCSVALAEEKSVAHQFEILGDEDLVLKFEKAYEKLFGPSYILSKVCDAHPKHAGKGLLIGCEPSASSTVIAAMMEVYAAATKNQKTESTLTIVVSSPK